MPTVMDIVDLAKALETKAVYLFEDRCTVVRNRNSKCTKCKDACPVDAVYAEKNVIHFDFETCIKCGACTTVCPCEALVPIDPLDLVVEEELKTCVPLADGCAAFACARIASKKIGDPEKYVEVPCLARVDEATLIDLAASGVDDILLIDGVCKTCKYRFTSAGTDITVETANQIIQAQGGSAEVKRVSEFPEHLQLEDYRQYLQESRRNFFSSTGTRAREAAVKTFDTLVLKNTDNKIIKSIKDRLQITEDGTLPQFEPQRHVRILDAMYSMGESVEPYIDTRDFGSVEIDTEKCKSCKMCTVFCPTHALRKTTLKPPEGQSGSYIEFQASECIQCKLCEDACMHKCLTVNSVVSTEELFDFEPRLILLPPANKRMGVLGNKK